MTASRQTTVNAHAIGSDRRGKAELSIETRPDAHQEAERARQDAQEAHDRRHPDNTHEEAVEAQEEDAEEQRERRRHILVARKVGRVRGRWLGVGVVLLRVGIRVLVLPVVAALRLRVLRRGVILRGLRVLGCLCGT